MTTCDSRNTERFRRSPDLRALACGLLLGVALNACAEPPATAPTNPYYIYNLGSSYLDADGVVMGVGGTVPLAVGRTKACLSFCGMEYLHAEWSVRDTAVATLQRTNVTDIFGDVVPGVRIVGKQSGTTIVTAHVSGAPTTLVMVR